MSIRHCKISASSPAEAAAQLQRIVADVLGDMARGMSGDERAELIAAYLASAADWLVATLGVDGCISALDHIASQLCTRRSDLELQRAQPAPGVH